MAKKSITKSTILQGYMDYLLEEGEAPKTVRVFTKHINISDEDFFNHFGSLKNIEQNIWDDYYIQTLNVIQKDSEFEEMNPREKHLSFLYTFMEVIKSDRSYILHKLEGKRPHELPSELKKTQKIITQSEIDWAKTFEFLPDRAQSMTQSSYRNVLWSHSIAVLFFWVKDDSAKGADTDVFIEKTTRTAFDIGELPALDSIIDLSKFFLQKMGFSKATA